MNTDTESTQNPQPESSFSKANARLDAEFFERVIEANGVMSMPVSPRMMREQWQFVAYLAEEQGKSIDDICGSLLDSAIDEAQAEYMANLPRK